MENQISREQLIELLVKAQNGDNIAEEQLIIFIRDNIMKRRIGRYLHRNRQCDDDDIMQEFLIGVASAIPKAELDIGDPIEFIVQQGVYRVRTYVRKNIMQNTTQVCMDCGYESRLNRVGNGYVCKKCGSHNIITREQDDHDETIFQTIESTTNDYDDILTVILFEKFEQSLDKNTNVYRLYELLKSGINKDNPQINNYIKTISVMWGGCSQQNVLQNIYKLQAKLTKFMEEQRFEIRENRIIDK